MNVRPALAIDRGKIEDYLLDLHHPHGSSKAKFFLGHGFTAMRSEEFGNALLNHAKNAWPGVLKPGRHGPLHEIKAELPTPNGTRPLVCSVWELRADGWAWLATAYPA